MNLKIKTNMILTVMKFGPGHLHFCVILDAFFCRRKLLAPDHFFSKRYTTLVPRKICIYIVGARSAITGLEIQ